MKRVQLIEIAVLTVALICGYNAFDSFFSLLVQSLYSFFGTYYQNDWGGAITYLIMTVVYFILFFVLVKKSKWIAAYIDRRGQINTQLLPEQKETILLKVHSESLLYIVLTVLFISVIVIQLPTVLIHAYDYFKTAVGGRQQEIEAFGRSIDFVNFKVAAAKLLVNIILLFYARPLAGWFVRSIQTTEPIIETDKEP